MDLLKVYDDWQDQVEVAKGEVIFSQGEDADFIYVVLEGEVEMIQGKEPLGAELPGGAFGEMALLGARRGASAVAIRPSKLARISREQFRNQIRQDPEIALHMMAVIANRLMAANAMLRF
jgi:CRP-like cAMP-binding protein